MTPKQILNLIPSSIFRELAIETKVDHQVKLLSGELIFKLILFSMLNSEKLSLRVMEKYLESAQFRSFTGYDITVGKYNSIRDRICSINADYFEGLFDQLFKIYSSHLNEEAAVTKLDSTYVSIAAKLFDQGMTNGSNTDKRFVKYSIGLKGSLPNNVKVFLDQAYVSEDLALSEVVNSDESLAGNIVVFDRGLRSREAFDGFSSSSKLFVCRGYNKTRIKQSQENAITEKPLGATVTLHSDTSGYLISKYEQKSVHKYRVIRGTLDATGEPICFISNMQDEDAYTIAKIYKQRWEIEVFFKFLKQNLNLNHLVSRTTNGIKVMIYMTLILAILIIVFKKLNKIGSYKIAKLQFELQLEKDIIKAIVELCGGDPNKAPHLFNSA
ncbi:MAG TPA: IS4 family transposase [Candidatus Babeliaceae bacterium]|jgi:hypothetical protein|nr:IS4 family transposase [Candidatus Babeliaceae bacterium]